MKKKQTKHIGKAKLVQKHAKGAKDAENQDQDDAFEELRPKELNCETILVTFVLPVKLFKRMQHVCEQDGIDMSNFVTDALEFWIDERNLKKFLTDLRDDVSGVRTQPKDER